LQGSNTPDGPLTTYDTRVCRRVSNDSSTMDKPIKYFDSARKPCKKTGSGDSSPISYLTEKLTKLETKLNKSSKKCAHDLSDSDIDSDQERVYESTGNRDPADKCLKLEEPEGIHLKSTELTPIRVNLRS